MIRKVYTPSSNMIIFPIPDSYVGVSLEISIFPSMEIHVEKDNEAKSTSSDFSFGAWADMEKSAEEICRDIRNERHFGGRKISL